MAIPTSNITENYDAFKILRESQLNTAMDYIDVQFNTYTRNNLVQIALDVFGVSYDYNNDGIATLVTPLADSVAVLADNETVTGSWTFDGTVQFDDTVISTSTFTSSGQTRCKVYLDTAVQVIPDSTLTAIAFNNEVYDVGAMHDNAINNNRVVIPAGGAGTYIFQAQVTFAASVTLKREIYIYKNGTAIATARLSTNSAADQSVLSVSTQDTAADGNFYEIRVYQDTGGALNVIQGSAVTFFNCIKVW